MKTLFEKIIDREIPAKIYFETETMIVIEDKFPKAFIHLLIIPKKKIVNLQSISQIDLHLMGEVVEMAKACAKKFQVEKSGYRLLVNNGKDAGQEIFHLHFHFLAGNRLGAFA